MDAARSKFRYSVLKNFILMSIVFSINHGCVSSFRNSPLRETKTVARIYFLQTEAIYLGFALSIFISPFIVKTLHSRNALIVGSCLNCVYIESFIVAWITPSFDVPAAIIGGISCGIGSSMMWTAQGSYLAKSVELFTAVSILSIENSTSYLAGIFAVTFLSLEVIFNQALCNSFLFYEFNEDAIFFSYFVILLLALISLFYVADMHSDEDDKFTESSYCYKITSALRLFKEVNLCLQPYFSHLTYRVGVAIGLENNLHDGHECCV